MPKKIKHNYTERLAKTIVLFKLYISHFEIWMWEREYKFGIVFNKIATWCWCKIFDKFLRFFFFSHSVKWQFYSPPPPQVNRGYFSQGRWAKAPSEDSTTDDDSHPCYSWKFLTQERNMPPNIWELLNYLKFSIFWWSWKTIKFQWYWILFWCCVRKTE